MGVTVAIVANSTWNLYNFRRGLIRAFRQEGCRVLLITPDGPERDKVKLLGAKFIPLTYFHRSSMNPLRDAALIRELTDIYRRENVTHALHFTIKPVIYGSLAARWTGVINISTLTGLGYTFLSGKWTNLLIRQLYRIALSKARLVLFHNPDDRALFINLKLCTPSQSAVVGGSGIPLADFPVVPYSEAEPGRCLFAGRLLVDKGIRDYVAAARLARKRYPELQFHVVGPLDMDNPAGISSGELNRWIADGDIIYDGVAEDIRPHLAAASLVVLPSYREGCPRVLLEAAAMGRALVGTVAPGVREVVRDRRNGILVPQHSPQSLARVIINLLIDKEHSLKDFGDYGRRLVEEGFSDASVSNVYLQAVFADDEFKVTH